MKKRIKENFSICVLICICFLCMTNANAKEITCDNLTEAELQYIAEQSDPKDLELSCKNGTPYTDEYLKTIKPNLEETITPYALVKLLNIPSFQQEKNNWCGPANLKQVIHFYNKSSKTQQEYANETETDTYGSAYVFRMVNVLNKYVPSGISYKYILGTSYTLNEFFHLVEATALNNRPMILHAMTKSLEIYNGRNLGHYLTVAGYLDVTGVGYYDTYSQNYGRGNVFGFHTDTKENVYKTISDGSRYIIHDTYSGK